MVGREKSHDRVCAMSERECSWLVGEERRDWSLDACDIDIVGRRIAKRRKQLIHHGVPSSIDWSDLAYLVYQQRTPDLS